MRIVSKKRLIEFWQDPRNPNAEAPLSAWYRVVRQATWESFNDVRKTYSSADLVGNKVVFDVGGNKYRIIAVINYDNHSVFLRAVLDHKEYEKGSWKTDKFKAKPKTRKTSGNGTGPKTPKRKQ